MLIDSFGEMLTAPAPNLTIRPLEDWIVYRYEDTGEGKIVIPDIGDPIKSARKRVMVVAVGPGRVTMDGSRIPIPVKPGDRIAMAFNATITSFEATGEKLYMVRESDVAGVIEAL